MALGVIILASAIVIFFLLRNQGGGGRGRGHVSNFVHAGRDGSFPTQKLNMNGFRNLFGRKNGGWVQQVGDERDFDSDSEEGIPMHDSRRTRELPRVPTVKPLPPLSEDMSMVTLQAPGQSSATDLPLPPMTIVRSRSPSPQPKSKPQTVNIRTPPIERKGTMDSMESTSSQFSRFSSGTKFHEHIDES